MMQKKEAEQSVALAWGEDAADKRPQRGKWQEAPAMSEGEWL